MLNRLLPFVLDVCLLRRGPEDAPDHPYAAIGAVLLNFALVMWVFKQDGAAIPILPAIQVTVVILLAIRLILSAHKRVERYPQAVFTFFATSFALGLVLNFSLSPFRNNPDSLADSPLVVLPLLIWAWSFVIDAHIFRRTLDSSFAIGMLLAVLLFATNNMLLDLWYSPLVENAGS